MSVANLCALCNNVLVANPVNQRHLSALSGSHVLAQCKRHAVLLARVMLLVTTCTGGVACQGEGRAHLLHYTFTHTFATRHVRTNVSDSRALGSAQACLAPEERCSVFVSSLCLCRRLHWLLTHP